MIYPTARGVALAAAGVPVSLALGALSPELWSLGAAWVVFAVALVGADAVLAADRQGLALELKAPGSAGTGRAAEAEALARWPGRGPARVELALETNDRFRAQLEPVVAPVSADGAGARFELWPERRGEGRIEQLWARWRGPLGLAWKQRSETLDRTVPVTPDLEGVREEALRLFARDAVHGMKVERERGEGTEFDNLLEFMPGMDRRAIDWKRSAAHGKLLAKQFRTERNHPVVLALDTGRLMSAPLDGLPRIDRALNAALLLAYVGLKLGDRVGLFAFDARPRLSTGTVSGPNAFALLQRRATALDYSEEEANFTLALTQLGGELKRRTLVIVFTDFADTVGAELMVENIGRLSRKHLVLFVVLRDAELERMVEAEPRTPEDVSRAVVAGRLMAEREVVLERLRRLGVLVLDAPLDRLGPGLLNGYLDVRARELL
jgi:uncharacterized protein (DUF58 family)